jgi:hypothetical protein
MFPAASAWFGNLRSHAQKFLPELGLRPCLHSSERGLLLLHRRPTLFLRIRDPLAPLGAHPARRSGAPVVPCFSLGPARFLCGGNPSASFSAHVPGASSTSGTAVAFHSSQQLPHLFESFQFVVNECENTCFVHRKEIVAETSSLSRRRPKEAPRGKERPWAHRL